MPPTTNPDHLGDLLKRFTRLSTTGDASVWLAARASWTPELLAFFGTHAPKRVRELDAILARPIPPAFPPLGTPLIDRDAVARAAMTDILGMLRELWDARAAARAAKPAPTKPATGKLVPAKPVPAKPGKGK